MEFKDILIICKDCGGTFIWLKGEQEFFYDHSLFPPKRCPDCRMLLKRKNNRMREEAERGGEAQNGHQ